MSGKFESVTDHLFVFGEQSDFMDGLTKKIKSCYRSMEEECTKNDNGKYIKEYNYVVRQKAQESRDLKQPHRIRDQGHNGMSLKDFCGLHEAKDAKLSEAEVAALRLYTGPLYIPWYHYHYNHYHNYYYCYHYHHNHYHHNHNHYHYHHYHHYHHNHYHHGQE